MNFFHPFIVSGIAVLLAGCAVTPDYHKPDISAPKDWISSHASQAAIEQNWWRNFNDPVLTELIQKATAGNLDLKIAETRIAGARAMRASATTGLLPTGNMMGTAKRQANQIAFPGSFPGVNLAKPFTTFQTGFDASWEPDLFGGKRRAVEAAGEDLEAAEAARDDAMVSLMAEVARTYVDIRQYQAQLAIAEDTVTSEKNSVDIAKQRYASGTAPHVEVTQGEAQLEQSQAQLPRNRNLLKQAEYSMDVLLGEQPGAAMRIVAPVMPIPLSDKKLVLAAPAAVIANRPDIRAAERKLASATAQKDVAVAQFFPDVSLSGFLGLLSTSSGNLLTAGSKSWSAGGNVLWPILNYGKLSANLDASKAQQQEALVLYQKTIIGALSDVERSVTAYTEQEKARQSLAESAKSSQHARDVSRQRYKAGMTSFLEVLDADRTLYAAQSQVAQANAQTSQDLIAVYKSLGGGWKP